MGLIARFLLYARKKVLC